MPTKPVPTPGSPKAVALGCDCVPELNHHGLVPPTANGLWWICRGCRLHEQWIRAYDAARRAAKWKGSRRGRR